MSGISFFQNLVKADSFKGSPVFYSSGSNKKKKSPPFLLYLFDSFLFLIKLNFSQEFWSSNGDLRGSRFCSSPCFKFFWSVSSSILSGFLKFFVVYSFWFLCQGSMCLVAVGPAKEQSLNRSKKMEREHKRTNFILSVICMRFCTRTSFTNLFTCRWFLFSLYLSPPE